MFLGAWLLHGATPQGPFVPLVLVGLGAFVLVTAFALSRLQQ